MMKPGKVFFSLVYVVSSIALIYVVLWSWKPDFLQLFKYDRATLIDERLVFLSGVLVLPSVLVLKGKKYVPIKPAAILSALWLVFILIVCIISVTTAQEIVSWVRWATKPFLFLAICLMLFWSYLELFQTGEKKR